MDFSPPEVDIECGVYGDLIIRYPKLYSVYLQGTIETSKLLQALVVRGSGGAGILQGIREGLRVLA